MGSPRDKLVLFELLYDAKAAIGDEKAAAWDKLNAEIDRVRAGTPYSRSQVKDMLYKDGYFEYAKRRRMTDRPGA